ncbi:MAG: hypothetical protein V4493_07550 [Pseudomonadota bacterium]
MQNGPFTIQLTPEEIELVDAIKFDPQDTLGNIQAYHANGDLVVQFVESLLKRNAIPDQRLKYFSDPEYHVGGRGNSRQVLFLRNAGSHDKMIRHGHFLKYLRYFIHGADLPLPIITAYAREVENCNPITSGDIETLTAAARQLARTHQLEPKSVAEEFYKLCLDLNLSPSDATYIRSSVLKIRP